MKKKIALELTETQLRIIRRCFASADDFLPGRQGAADGRVKEKTLKDIEAAWDNGVRA